MTDSDDVEDAPKWSCPCMLLAILGRGNSGGMEREPANDGFGEDVVDEIRLTKSCTPVEPMSFFATQSLKAPSFDFSTLKTN